jgi:hypothetical protein
VLNGPGHQHATDLFGAVLRDLAAQGLPVLFGLVLRRDEGEDADAVEVSFLKDANGDGAEAEPLSDFVGRCATGGRAFDDLAAFG